MIGILGGSFDPIHYGHLRTALDVQQTLELEEIRLIPLRDPPHRGDLHCNAETRLEMVRTAVADEPLFRVDDREVRRTGKSFTLDTLLSLRAELGEQQSICLLMGTDAFRGFPGWYKPSEILKQAHLVIMQRPGERTPEIYLDRTTTSAEALKRSAAGRIMLLPVTQLEISATRIRAMLRAGLTPRYLLPDSVLAFIEQQALYR